jgi:hypothetical protein
MVPGGLLEAATRGSQTCAVGNEENLCEAGMDAPAPAPEMVTGARRHLTERYATGVDRLLWETEKHPMPDAAAITAAVAAGDRADALDIASALVLVQASRLALDHLEHDLFAAGQAAGITAATIAAVLDLPDEAAAQARQHWLTGRRAMPHVDAGLLRMGAQGSPAHAADRAGRRPRRTAERAAESRVLVAEAGEQAATQ